MIMDSMPKKLMSKIEVIVFERDLAKWAGLMDSLVRIPFTRQGIGLDALLGMIPVLGDIAGLILTLYVWHKAKHLGLPISQRNRILQWAFADAVLGLVPILGTLLDILIQPSRQAMQLVHQHIQQEYQLENDLHVQHPYLHERLAQKQQQSAFWRHPLISWLWLHSLDLLVLAFILLVVCTGFWLIIDGWGLKSHS